MMQSLAWLLIDMPKQAIGNLKRFSCNLDPEMLQGISLRGARLGDRQVTLSC